MPRRSPLVVASLVLAMTACHPAPATTCSDCAAHEAAIATWRHERMTELRAEQGWLALVGLYWLADGEHRLGADLNADLVFPAGAPPNVGVVTVRADEVTLTITDGVDATIAGQPIHTRVLRSDATPPADRVQIADRFTLLVLSRGDRLALRLYDAKSPAREQLHAIDSFPVAPTWRISARFEALAEPRTIEQPTVLGTVQPAEVPGTAIFTVDGQDLRLTPILEQTPHGPELLFVFRDATSGAETYPGGRFLIADMPKNGTIELDFNRAHNPPCAFTPYATCPLPLPENRLPIRIEAGEKSPPVH